jgi:hypothetical protein
LAVIAPNRASFTAFSKPKKIGSANFHPLMREKNDDVDSILRWLEEGNIRL